MDDFKSIAVTFEDRKMVINNPTDYPLIGHGIQGAVFQISDDRCVKIYHSPIHARKEQESLFAGRSLPFIPKVYEYDSMYIVMEFFKGPMLKSYLRKQRKLPVSTTKQLLFMLKEMKRIGFTKLDVPLRHVLVTKNGFKLVDHVYSLTDNDQVPAQLFKDLSDVGLLTTFLQQVKEIDPQVYEEWGVKE